MQSKERDKLIEKYLEAESNLNEEQEIFNAENVDSEINPWYSIAKRSRAKAPENLNNSVWEAIQTKRIRGRRLIYGIGAAAASIALIISLSVNSPKQSYEEKEALLKEALAMFEENEPQQEVWNIIYEDELIVIYTAQNK